MKFAQKIAVAANCTVIELLADATSLSKTKLKDCLGKGCVWLARSRKKERRIRKSQYELRPGDQLTLYYDSEILSVNIQDPQCLAKEIGFSVWNKPAMMLSQGTRFGDHCSLLRRAEKILPPSTTPHLVHRLDREACGLILLAHGRRNAAAFSRLFREHNLTKRYEAVVEGVLGEPGYEGVITEKLDGKATETHYRIVAVAGGRTLVDINLITGRFHQIRRHFSNLGFPLAGDLRYGKEKGEQSLKLVAWQLNFKCPDDGQLRTYTLPASDRLSSSF